MGQNQLIKGLKEKLIELNHKEFFKFLEEALEKGVMVQKIIFEALTPGMQRIGELFERGEYFLTDMLIASEMFKEAMEKMKPLIEKRSNVVRNTVVIGTVRGDIHDIGKNLVATMLEASGFNVINLGVDVPKEEFVEAVKKNKAKILALSALLSVTVKEMGEVISELIKTGLRNKVKVIIGGLQTSETLAKEIGTDSYGKDAIEAVKKCKKLIEES